MSASADLANAVLDRLFGPSPSVVGLQSVAESTLGPVLDLLGSASGGKGVEEWLARLGGDPQAGAVRLADHLIAAVPASVRDGVTRGFNENGSAKDRSTALRDAVETLPPAERSTLTEDAKIPDRLLDALKADKDSKPAYELFVTWQRAVEELAGVMPALAAARWNDPRNAKTIADRIIGHGKRLAQHLKSTGKLPTTTAEEVLMIELEAKTLLPERLLIASPLSLGGMAATGSKEIYLGAPSNRALGQQVHQTLQTEFRSAPTRFPHLIVQEGKAYYSGRALPLLRAAVRSAVDGSLWALWLARSVSLVSASSAALAQDAELRDDNIDFNESSLWEIKPIRGAAPGVLQEFVYRSTYNLYVAVLKDFPGAAGTLALVAGHALASLLFTCHRLFGGMEVAWPELATNRIRAVKTATGQFVIVVYQVDPLPGLVLYLVVDLPVASIALFAKVLASLLNDLAKKLQQAMRALAEAVAVALMFVVAALALFALIPSLVAAGVEAVAFLAPLLAGLGARAAPVLGAAKRIGETAAPLQEQFGFRVEPALTQGAAPLTWRCRYDPDAESSPDLRLVDLTAGFLRIERVPIQMLSVMEDAFVVAFGVAEAVCRKAKPKPRDNA